MTKCVIYARVSSEEQARTGYSIDAQVRGAEAKSTSEQLDVAARFTEVHSAKDEGRPKFDAMIRFLLDHPDVRVVVVDKQDRLARNLIDFGVLRDRLGCRVVSVKDPTEDTPEGHFMQDINLAFATQYSRNLSREVRKGLTAKFEAGGMVSKAPVAYRNVSRTRTEKGRVVVDDEKAPAIRWLFEQYAAGGRSLHAMALALYDYGLRAASGRPLSDEMVRNVLAHPAYKGLVTYQGEIRPGAHPAIVGDELFERVQKMLEHRGAGHGEKGVRFFLLRGIVSCGRCGRRMTAEVHPRKKAAYYRCLPDALGGQCAAR